MAEWVNCASTPGYIAGWAADLGEYAGPWSIQPPAVLDGIVGWLYFYVLLPRADDPSPAYAGDGSYATPVWMAARLADSNPSQYQFQSALLGSQASLPAVPPAGAHLYVASWSNLPPSPPESYVPPTYARTGRASYQTAPGTWSSPQPGFTFGATAYASSASAESWSFERYNSYNQSFPPPWDLDVGTEIETLLSTIDSGLDSGGVLSIGFSAYKASGISENNVQASVSAFTEGEVFDLRSILNTPQRPPALDALTEYRDYGPCPFADPRASFGSEYSYPAPYVAEYAWITALGTQQGSAHNPLGVTPPDVSLRVGWIAGTTTPSLRPSPDSYTLVTPAVSANPVPLSVDLSGAGESPLVTVTVAANCLYTGHAGASDIPMGALDEYSFGSAVIFDATSTASASVTTQPWQYYIPGAIVPAPPAIPPYLRMNQRNDGLGIHAHPRIPIGPNRPSSIQSAQLGTGAPRIGTKNRYL